MKTFNQEETAKLLPMRELVDTLSTTIREYAAGKIISPERLVVPLKEGGVMLSMPASADDIAIHKLVNVNPRNAKEGLPTIQGQVLGCDALRGTLLFSVDGPTVTGCRTAAVTMLAIARLLERPPKSILLIGTGKQASNHVEAIAEMFPQAQVRVRGHEAAKTAAFVARYQRGALDVKVDDGSAHQDADVVITLTTSKTPVYSELAKPGCLVIGVGAFTPDAAEIAPITIAGSTLYVDDPLGARHEAGDLIQADIDWSRVKPLASALDSKPDFSKPILFKSVGCGAWDLAACRVIKAKLNQA
ncbi:delta(1)-pyrroline-2-carboxylate reductase family protein [Pseudomonas cavernicola]|uniref:Delta(1)-pyrroline-2-carboxylate reductase family protein n=2 Tax=Pseudomonas cavernicola TaxID=2320866 RepID=A0A418X9L9_9PSED|nr:bifunctional Delta(1)-pyrroline-2-carboxylate/Delta(1)-piperideine-2-carboxylate reductase [Pseudomonas cavernicola]RJG09160.1 delta(1)-pyrroline-2-carboxylate reductase family protein [Pseudomonas cavernicola]RJG09172.1 delta(1)-pyrroline-2-carboxylate reductase family protein [Pseudomonas cavernicola]